MDILRDHIVPHFNFWVYVIIMMIGLWAMISKNNLIKKLIGMSIFQTAIILFYVSIGVKEGAQIPILHHGGDDHGGSHHQEVIDVDLIANPLPHVLMLTAIVVGVATLGVALAVSQRIFKEFGTLEENEILEKIRNDPKDG